MIIRPESRIYIAGSGGMLGAAVYQHFSRLAKVQATDIDVNESWLSYADVRDYRSIRESILRFNPDVIINLAALTDLEQCEREPDNAWLTNALGAENLGLIANELDAVCIYISTAGIFDGKQDAYSDFDVPNPLSVYGKSKYHGETFVCQRVRKCYVPRAGWMMGGGPAKDKKFINKIYQQICEGRTELRAVNDKAGTPTYTVDFAAGLERLIASDLFGLYNHSGEGRCSRLDVAREFVRLLGLDTTIAVHEVDSRYFAKDYFAVRPASEALINTKLRARGIGPMRPWQECLRDYAQVYLQDYAQRTGGSRT